MASTTKPAYSSFGLQGLRRGLPFIRPFRAGVAGVRRAQELLPAIRGEACTRPDHLASAHELFQVGFGVSLKNEHVVGADKVFVYSNPAEGVWMQAFDSR